MKYIFILSASILVIFTSCNDNDCVSGGGTLNDYPISVGSFDKIVTSGPINIEITQGSRQDVVITAEPEIFGIMEYRVRESELEVGFENKSCIKSSRGITLKVTVPDLKRINISGYSNISSIGDLDLDQLTIKVSGSADVALSGSATTQKFDVSGSIDVENYTFETVNTDIDVSGSGDFEIYCTSILDIKISGSATVKYKGNPQISQDISGSISLLDSN